MLLSDEGSFAGYVLRAWLLAFLPVIPLAALATWAFPNGAPDLGKMPVAFVVVYGIVGAPLIETALMSAWLLLARRFVGSVAAVLSSAVLWAAIHGVSSIQQGLTVWWPFLIFSIAFLVWNRRGYDRGFAAAATIHALHNATAFALLLIAV